MANSAIQPPTVYEATKETWQNYMGRFQHFLMASGCQDYTEPRKMSLFFNHCGPEVYQLAMDLSVTEDGTDITWAELQQRLKKHLEPAPSPVVSRFHFFKRDQKEGESIFQFEMALRKVARHCEFESFLEKALLTQFTLGIRDKKLQRRMLEVEDITFKTALAMARASEASNKDLGEIHPLEAPAVTKTVAQVTTPGSGDEDSDSQEEVCRVDKKREATRPRGLACFSCGGPHRKATCRFKDARCQKCGKKGHIEKICWAPTRDKPQGSNRESTARGPRREDSYWEPRREEKHQFYRKREEPTSGINYVDSSQVRNEYVQPMYATVYIEGSPCKMQLDTGSSITIMAWETAKALMPGIKAGDLGKMKARIADCQGTIIPVLGTKMVAVSYKEQRTQLQLTIAKGGLSTLLGRDWFKELNMKVTRGEETVNAISMDGCEDILREFADVFDPALGKYVGTPISFSLDPSVQPIRCRSRKVPFALKPPIDKELDRLIEQGVLEPVDHAKWETPIVPVLKGDGSVRICADYKCSINKAMQQSAYPVPVVQHLLHTLGPGKIFAKLDLAQAYQQLPVDRETAEAQTIVTHRGAFKCNRLQFGVSVAPGIFQSIMERVLSKIPGVVPYFDDVLISAANISQLRSKLREVLSRFRAAGLRAKAGKCQIGVPEVEFLGYRINGNGLHPTMDKLRAIREAPAPKNKLELQAFLGLLNFYAMFLKDKATVAEPLHQLLAKNKVWEWGQEQEIAFNGVKRLLTQESFLMQFTETLPVVLVCDASPFGVGAVLSHRLPNGKEAPIAYFSRTLSPAERNYGQIDREALAAVAGVKRFHEYLFGRQFELVTDHKPLLGLLAGNKPTPDAMPARMLRWALFLSAYSYTLVYRQGKEMGNADALSRVPLPDLVDDPTPHWPVFRIDLLGEGVVTAKDIAAETEKDADLRTVMDWVKRGWPKGPYTQSMLPFAKRQHEISIQEGCVLWGERVISPPSLREEILRELHEGHPGIVRMKALARSYVWWPSMDKEIEDWVGGCQPCQQSRPNPPVTPAWEWENPRAPWSRIHIDFAGPFHGQTFLVVVDAYSKWAEVKLMRTTTAEAVIRTLRQIFTTHGFPDTVVSDNGPQFTAAEFEGYLAGLGVKHSLSPPFNPSTNGQAERAVRTTKEVLSRLGPGDWQERIDIFLLAQHITPSGESGKSPAELLMGRKLRSKMDRLHPRFTTREAEERAPVRTLKLYSQVFARDYTGRQKWAPGKIHEIIGPKTYIIELGDGQYWHRHINQLRERKTPNADWRSPDQGVGRDNHENNPIVPPAVPHSITDERLVEVSPETGGNSNDSVTWGATPKKPRPLQDQHTEQDSLSLNKANGGIPLRRSARVTTKPAHLKDYVC